MHVRRSETISVTDIQRQTKEIFQRIESGEQEKFVILRNNQIAAVLLPAERYEALLDELEDLRIDALAAERLATFDPHTVIPLESLLDKYNVPRDPSS